LRRDCVELALRAGLRADDYFFYGESDEHKQRCKQHIELGGSRRDEYCHYAGDIHIHIGEWFDERKPDVYGDLRADSNQRRWLDHVYPNHYRKRGK
jgi:hypothetical protein